MSSDPISSPHSPLLSKFIDEFLAWTAARLALTLETLSTPPFALTNSVNCENLIPFSTIVFISPM